ncbi:XRE family transcriptional regulator [Haloechinothrix salitolerans]|uniref:Helix-turn-helix domain-containing protein n=1 Tax=Haloechinothrix salitolerans TaxID=926830 RepID=A0ABW2C146_9PSEU
MTEENSALPAEDLDEAGAELEEALSTVIAERVREFRQQLGWTVGKLAAESGLSKGMLSKIENMQTSPSLATLASLSQALSVPVTAFFRGLSEEQDVVFVKAGSGLDIHHKGSGPGHRYQMLGAMRAPHDRLEPILVTLTERSEVFPLYQHAGTELIFMISGKMEYAYGSARYLLEPGDTLQFVGEVMHGPAELISLPIQFLAVKAVNPGS